MALKLEAILCSPYFLLCGASRDKLRLHKSSFNKRGLPNKRLFCNGASLACHTCRLQSPIRNHYWLTAKFKDVDVGCRGGIHFRLSDRVLLVGTMAPGRM